MKRIVIFTMLVALVLGVQAQQPEHKCQHGNCQKQASCQKSDGCKQSDKQSAETGYKSLTVDEFSQQVSNEKVVVLDVRTPKEYAEGHLKGAINVVWGNEFDAQVKKVNLCPKKTVAVYCRSGRRSKAAAESLVKMGYKVIELDKGIVGWQQAGKDIVK